MKELLPDIWQWSWFSEEKQLDFNGLFLKIGERRVLIDPPPLTEEVQAQIRHEGLVDYIVITNRDHERESAASQKEFGCEVYVPEADAPSMLIKADKTYKDRQMLPGGLWVVHLENQKSPGESALFLHRGDDVMIVGDALIGKPPGSLTMLPAEKYADVAKAREGLRRLLAYHYAAILVGDGASILTEARQAVEQALRS